MPRTQPLLTDDPPTTRPGADRTALAVALFAIIAVSLGAARLLQPFVGAAPGAMIMISATVAPLVAALAASNVFAGHQGMRALMRRAIAWRVPVRWYALGLLTPLGASIVALVVFGALGGAPPTLDSDLLLLVPQVVTVGLLFALAEELGWRGWLQHQLQGSLDPRVAALAVGVVWAAWHAPLHHVADTVQADLSLPIFVVVVFAVSVLFAALYNATEGSVPVLAVAHVGFNLAIGLPLLALPTGAQRYLTICAVLAVILAAVVWCRGPGERLDEDNADEGSA